MAETTTASSGAAEGGGAAGDITVRPFAIDVPQEALDELRRRIVATRWPEQETVADQSQGVQLATMRALADYWAGDYDLRRFEARLNAFPQFMTEIDGLDIHFLHARSPHEHALPLIITHGWPGSVIVWPCCCTAGRTTSTATSRSSPCWQRPATGWSSRTFAASGRHGSSRPRGAATASRPRWPST